MARQPALTGEREAEARKLLAAGISAREIGRRLGVDHKTIGKLKTTTPSPSAQTGQRAAPTEAPAPVDDFERQQLDLLKLLDAKLDEVKLDDAKNEVPAVSARDLAGLVKAKNDTIKAIRAHRAMASSSANDPGTLGGIADLVKARLKRLAEVGTPAVAAEPPEQTEDEEEPTGT
jgi:transcriptional regulator with XRE-family HTH domain